jgi:hypothetical protein
MAKLQARAHNPPVPNVAKLPEGWTTADLGRCATRITKGSTPTSYGLNTDRPGLLLCVLKILQKVV